MSARWVEVEMAMAKGVLTMMATKSTMAATVMV